jgi:hypothetical protein
MLWRAMADIVVAVHAAYVAIVVVGFAAILIGSAAQWRWVRNFYFRAAHLAMILLVCAEALVGTTCPLTRLENALRLRGGETGYARDFIGCMSSEPSGQVSNRFKRGFGPSELKFWLRLPDAAGVVARWF